MMMSSLFVTEVKEEDKFLHDMCFREKGRRSITPRKIPLPILRTWVRTRAGARRARCIATLYTNHFLSRFIRPHVALFASTQIDNRLANKCEKLSAFVFAALRLEPKKLRPAALKNFLEHAVFMTELWPFLGSSAAALGGKMNAFGWRENSARRVSYSKILSQDGFIGWSMGDTETRTDPPFAAITWDEDKRCFVHAPGGALLSRFYNAACLLKPKPVVATEEGDDDDAPAGTSRDDDAAASDG
jgi:hypothetical protein